MSLSANNIYASTCRFVGMANSGFIKHHRILLSSFLITLWAVLIQCTFLTWYIVSWETWFYGKTGFIHIKKTAWFSLPSFLLKFWVVLTQFTLFNCIQRLEETVWDLIIPNYRTDGILAGVDMVRVICNSISLVYVLKQYSWSPPFDEYHQATVQTKDRSRFLIANREQRGFTLYYLHEDAPSLFLKNPSSSSNHLVKPNCTHTCFQFI